MSDQIDTDDDATGLDPETQRAVVRERYSSIAASSGSCCGDDESSGCCDEGEDATGNDSTDDRSLLQGYTEGDLEAVEPGANLNLGCGNPTAIASLSAGETVLDLGSGAGFDCFLAAREVGETGRVIGVDMTPEMIRKARTNAERNDAEVVEFRLGEIEHLPVADESVDVIISNCVINLSPDKPQVFREAYRVLRPGGRLAVSDVVRTAELPKTVRLDPDSISACVAGASTIRRLESMIEAAGFVDVCIEPKDESEEFIREWDDELDVSDFLVSASIEATKPSD